MYSSWEPVSSSVCVIMPPRDLWGPFVEIKKNHMNPRIKRPPYPHITLCAPFVDPKNYSQAKLAIRESLKSIEPFEINFANFELFKNKKSTTLYLAPQSKIELMKLHETFINSLPESIIEKQNNFEPHIGVGYFKDKNDNPEMLREKYQSSWTPLKFTVQEVYFLNRKDQTSPWQIEEIVSLGQNELPSLFHKGETTDSTN